MFPVGGDNEERDGGVYTGGPVGGGRSHTQISLLVLSAHQGNGYLDAQSVN